MLPDHEAGWLHSTAHVRADPIQLPDGTLRAPLRPDSFDSFVGHKVLVPGLDPALEHVLAAARVADDGCSARLAIHTRLDVGSQLLGHLNLAVDTPEAQVRLVDHDTGEVLHESTHTSPLQEGAVHRLGGQIIQVVASSWPNRHPEHGSVQADPDTGEYPPDVQELRVKRISHPAVQAVTS